MTNEEIGHRIKTEREKLGLTLQEVADLIGVHKSTIYMCNMKYAQ